MISDIDLIFGMWVYSDELQWSLAEKHLRASLIFTAGTFVSFRHI